MDPLPPAIDAFEFPTSTNDAGVYELKIADGARLLEILNYLTLQCGKCGCYASPDAGVVE